MKGIPCGFEVGAGFDGASDVVADAVVVLVVLPTPLSSFDLLGVETASAEPASSAFVLILHQLGVLPPRMLLVVTSLGRE